MSGIGNNNPFAPRTPHSQTEQSNTTPSGQSPQAQPNKEQKPLQKDTIGKTPDLSPQQKEQEVESEVITEVTSLNPDSFVEEELQEAETTDCDNLEEANEGQTTQQGQAKTTGETRRNPVNIGKFTMNEDGHQTDTPDESIGHLANTLLEGSPESLCDAAEAAAYILSEDEDEESSDQGEHEKSDEEENDNDQEAEKKS